MRAQAILRVLARQERARADGPRRRAGVAPPAYHGLLHRQQGQGPRVAGSFRTEDVLLLYVLLPFSYSLARKANVRAAGSIIVKQIGHAVLTVALPGGGTETFVITLPRLRIDGIWYGSPYIELTDTSYIQSSSGWLSTVRTFLLSLHLFIPSWVRCGTANRSSTRGADISPANRTSSRRP